MSQVDEQAPVIPAAPTGRPKIIWIVAAVGVLWFLIGGLIGGQYAGKLTDVQKNDNAAYLPASAESTKVNDEAQKFAKIQSIPGFIVYQRASGLTAADKTKIAADYAAFPAVAGIAVDQVAPPVYSTDDTTAQISVPMIGKNGNVSIQGTELAKVEKNILKVARANAPPGLVVHSAGAGGLLAAFIDSFAGIDGQLLVSAVLVVIVILLVVYRSPVLWFFPLLSSIIALGASSLIIYYLAKHNVLTLNGQSQGILFVLVLGAGTDYALLLVSRYREELHAYESRLDAMMAAWRGAAPAIATSGVTVILGLLCLTFGELNSDRSLGPVCAIGIACTLGVMLTFLPLALLAGRWIFWPRVPHVDHAADLATHGVWGRFATWIGRRARISWAVTTAVLIVCVFGLLQLHDSGLSTVDGFTNKPDAVQGQKIFDAKFDAGSGAPAVITTSAASAAQVIAAVEKVPGVTQTAGSVCIQPDYQKLAALIKATGASSAQVSAAASSDQCAPAALQVAPVDGRTIINAAINYRYDTPQANQTIVAIRKVVHAIPGAGALVGGQTAITYDTQQASAHDRNLIIPIVLLVILIVLGLVLRALLAPVLLILTVVLSFTATLGISALVFNHVFHFAGADPGFPLFAFVFLVALGIDYNIFLMTRVREETLQHGTRQGVLRGLSVTGGVITSAGLVLAATFAVLGVLPAVFLAEVGFAVAFGVLLDTIVVRSILVPALAYDLGKVIWWPSKLAKPGAAD
jgi:putative drug exporter of the RND superfamily